MARYAAVDIGSNSVRMLAAEVVPGSPVRTLALDREVTRLGASVFTTGRVSADAMDSVCSVLRRFGESYGKLDIAGVRAVATSAIRDASNQADFISRASEALGAPVVRAPAGLAVPDLKERYPGTIGWTTTHPWALVLLVVGGTVLVAFIVSVVIAAVLIATGQVPMPPLGG